MLEVAVIGAGASALVASRHLVGQGLRPSIFEAAKAAGGAWATGTNKGKMWDGMHTNLSKHTCRFSEWPWPDDTPLFPSAVDVHNYLESYAQKFLDPTCFQYQCQVTNVEMIGSENDQNGYRVEWTDLTTSTTHSKDFKGVVIATGFFSKPHFPDDLDLDSEKIQKRVLHSSQYQSSAAFVNQTVAVIGSSFSALEIAADVSKTAKSVINVVPNVPWVIPRYIPHKTPDDPRASILPVDLAFYRRTKDAPELPESIEMTKESSNKRHAYLNSIVGKRQEETPLGTPSDWDQPPFVTISDKYLDLLIQGDIEVIHGRLKGLHPSDPADNEASAVFEVESPTGQSIALKDTDKVICCTGYEPNLESFLGPDMLQVLEYDAKDKFSPMTSCWETIHPSLPNLSFCGMYRGPYMGIMELQGRLAAQLLNTSEPLDKSKLLDALEASRRRRGQALKPQFPHFDYVGFQDTLASHLSPSLLPTVHLRQGDVVTPAFYQEDQELVDREVDAVEQVLQKGLDGSRIPSLVLSAIIGEWDFDRRIVHFSNNHQEHVYGAVKYSRPNAGEHVVYREDGFYELAPTKTLNVFREYEYEVNGNCLELYFVENGERAHLFLSLKFTPQSESGDYWVATSDHLCIKDLYQAKFRVRLDGLVATELQITYRVQGPAKDYESTTIMIRRQVA